VQYNANIIYEEVLLQFKLQEELEQQKVTLATCTEEKERAERTLSKYGIEIAEIMKSNNFQD